ncbi:MAG: hypothetical protein M2R45_01531 [Verrucomicrobia subdivision 3 bacterium]|nr:hypothetical protein [Limisphaerales bacterium]MCS1413341.1 hypothetical protein [Limisphaerales bacterium]
MADDLPRLNAEAFRCPHCNIFAQQRWVKPYDLHDITIHTLSNLLLDYRRKIDIRKQATIEDFLSLAQTELLRYLDSNYIIPDNFSFAKCIRCHKYSLWLNSDMIYPASTPFPAPNEDFNDDIKELCCEAAVIFNASPRASAAMMRLCVEKILKEQLG